MAESSSILSVGIDVGTSTTQLVFSRLTMDNSAGYFTVPRVSIVDKKVVYKSRVYLTPLKNESLIDTDKLKDIVSEEFRLAGYTPADTDSGAVIITGESARKENADAVLESLSGFAGDFVVSAAGPDIESEIAGKGSGAWQYSQQNHSRVINMDIGGGTTNVVLFDNGITKAKGCLDIGGRLIRVDEGRNVTYISPAARIMARAAGLDIETGHRLTASEAQTVTSVMAAVLENYMGFVPSQPFGTDLKTLAAQVKTPGSSPFMPPAGIDAIFFSGGVGELIYHEEADDFKYGDIGVFLGRAIRRSALCSERLLVYPGETIRATVVGAGTYTTTISGSTITWSHNIFPLKNIPVIKLDEKLQSDCFAGNSAPLTERIRYVLGQNDMDRFVLAMDGPADPGYREMKQAAAAIGRVMDEVEPPDAPILLVIESDIAKAMGQMIRQLPGMKRQVVSIDSIHVEDGEYIDMGKPMMDGMIIPVVVKTLIFE